MTIDASTAGWFAPFVIPICLYVCWTDMARMKITNVAVIALALVFLIVGLVALPLAAYPWRLLAMAVVLVVGFLMSSGGLLGAGDAKFAAAGIGFVSPSDYGIFMVILACATLAGFVIHRAAAKSFVRGLAPDWESWRRETEFPFGLGLGGGLIAYLVLAIATG